MYKEIKDQQQKNYEIVVNRKNKENTKEKKRWYQKHMDDKLINLEKIEWIKELYNCFLIRKPKNVINY